MRKPLLTTAKIKSLSNVIETMPESIGRDYIAQLVEYCESEHYTNRRDKACRSVKLSKAKRKGV